MNDSSFASLSPTLLARKGGAKPAMRPQIAPLHGENASGGAALAANLEDLGWNDMGEPYDEPEQVAERPLDGLAGLTPEPAAPAAASPAKQQLEELASRIASQDSDVSAPSSVLRSAQPDVSADAAADAPAAKPRRSALSRGKRAAFTLRLDSDRHLKLRLASTVRGRSAQALMTDALDRLLGDMPEIDKMAAQAANK